MAGYYNRFIGYTEEGFQEGVSLTYYDELMRWQKYAWGCSELVFNPIPQWPRKGPLNKLFIRFLMSNIHFYTKVGRQPLSKQKKHMLQEDSFFILTLLNNTTGMSMIWSLHNISTAQQSLAQLMFPQ